MIKLKKVTINKYKSIETEQSFDVEDDITVLVGKNESGKTAILEAINKSNPNDQDDKLDETLDYPKKQFGPYNRSDVDVTMIRCTYELSEPLLSRIREDIGPDTLANTEIDHKKSYRNNSEPFDNISVDLSQFLAFKLGQQAFADTDFKEQVEQATSRQQLTDLKQQYTDAPNIDFLQQLIKYFQHSNELADALRGYVIHKWLQPGLPKYLYYDEYNSLPSDINISKLQNKSSFTKLEKTFKALFELAGIQIHDLFQDNEYERYNSKLEATSSAISDILFRYWTTNTNLDVECRFEGPPSTHPNLKIRIRNNKYRMTLPLGSRSKGFNWFFSFLVWFSKIQEDPNNNYIVLLDEPGLNLHASAQADWLRFIEDLAHDEELSKNYQLIYTTHSPFMVESNKLHRVRTVLETDSGTRISDSIQEKDPDTLFPLQAALGYDIAQNLFIAQNNLLVEGVSDLIYLQTMSSILHGDGRDALREDITIVPVGGLDKVATFISLLRGQQLNIACLLDTFTDQNGKQRVEDMVKQKIIRDRNIRFFDEFAASSGDKADMEDMFSKCEYLNLFNQAFHEHNDINLQDLCDTEKRIVKQIKKKLGKRFNHHRPANSLAKLGADAKCFSNETLNRFEKMFEEVNKLFPSNT